MAFGRGGLGDEWGLCGLYVFYFINTLCILGGMALTVVGIWLVGTDTTMARLLGSDQYLTSAYILLITGLIVTVVGFVGCCGAIKSVKAMLLIYAIVYGLMFITLLVGAIIGYVFRDEIQEYIYLGMLEGMRLYLFDYDYQEAWDDTQIQLQCCGIFDFFDWQSQGVFRRGLQVSFKEHTRS